jgi:hypothetical protein
MKSVLSRQGRLLGQDAPENTPQVPTMHIISSFSLLNKADFRYIFIHRGVWVTHFVTLASYRHRSLASEGYNSALRLSPFFVIKMSDK